MYPRGNQIFALVVVGSILALVTSCGGDDETGKPARVCDPGSTQTCVGPGACQGGQSCNSDGSSWNACECVDAGGAGGAPTDGGGPGGSAGTGAVAGAGATGGTAGAGGGSSKCPQGRGPTMVDVGSFCVDSTDVTQKQYDDFLKDQATNPTQQVGACTGNPLDNVGKGLCSSLYDPAATPTLPVGCVDWCDAWAFCAWAGKRLCGKLGGGPMHSGEVTQAHNSEWAHVCTQGGSTEYPWGNASASNCNFGPCPVGTTCVEPVASNQKCTGATSPFNGVFDLLGNQGEWVEACDTQPPWPGCYAVGGTHHGTQTTCFEARAKVPYLSDRRELGIRCCADRDP